MKHTAREVFQNNELLRHVHAAGLDRVAEVAVRRSYQRGARIFTEGDAGDAVFGVISGHVQIIARTSSAHEIFLDVVRSGGVFGEISVVDHLPRCVTARAATDVEVFMICRDNFLRLMAADRMVTLGLIDLLCERVRCATRLIIEEYAQGNISARLAHRILQMTVTNGGITTPQHSLSITQAELAKFVFVSRQVVNHHLNDWQSRGWILTSRRSLVVIDRVALDGVARNNGTGSHQG